MTTVTSAAAAAPSSSWTCKFSPPSLQSLTYAVIVHGSCCILGAIPLGTLLYHVRRSSSPRLPSCQIVGIIVGTSAALIVPAMQSYIEDQAPNERVRWIGPFLSSTFGFTTFFKSINAGFGQFPDGADVNLPTWLCWFVTFPEPEFAKGKMCRSSKEFFWERVRFFVYKILALFVLLTILSIIHNEQAQSESNHSNNHHHYQILQWPLPVHTLGFLHIWLIYLYASFCLDFSSLINIITSGGRMRPNPGFRNPLLASRHLTETWGTRWNLPVQLLLKRTVYVPARMVGFGTSMSAILTFLVSGLLHEYNFSIHNSLAYDPYKAMVFFMLMGVVMLFEKWAWENLFPSRVKNFVDRSVPSAVTAVVLTMSVSATFEHFFIQSWLKSGFLGAVEQLIPHLECTIA
ncbi:hypothetical protein ACHAXR_004133 [Thalassiosira sp. AJA248-18]